MEEGGKGTEHPSQALSLPAQPGPASDWADREGTLVFLSFPAVSLLEREAGGTGLWW